MFIVTADQRDSQTGADLVPAGIATVERAAADGLALPPERTAGDEIQAAITSAASALAVILALTRAETWSVGLGVGDVEAPLPREVRAARGAAFVRARDAVDRAKKAPSRIAISGEGAGDAEALVRLLVELRDRRTDEGWEVHDLLVGGITQREAAERIGISEGAVSRRVSTAALRTEEAAVPALTRILEALDPD
ncbi:winged helix-turn-helix transcriptional regulator [Microbacterium suaedae]|uniref:winged helix-turn-helix transcriptional regulator n=1 Tax=Microbacterium suaedae TaxID=2067813 RepID=UPI000DA210BC|nr:winged helix-turn-helix transcriptional regulator [Microbacterium suaedae]